MKSILKTVTALFLGGSLLPCLTAATTSAPTHNPYEMIAASNIFRLLPPPGVRPDPNARPGHMPLPKIFITGLVELKGVPRAVIEIDKPGRPVQQAILAAGGACDVVQMLEIDVRAEKVHVRVEGTDETLTLEARKAAAKSVVAPPLPMIPGRLVPRG